MKELKELISPSLTTILEYPPIKAFAATAGVALGSYIDLLRSQFLGTILLLVLFDALTGTLVAAKRKKLSSYGWRRTGVKLANYCILVTIGILTNPILMLSWMNLGQVFTMLIITTEIISILENISILQPRLIPKVIRDVLEVIKERT